jgi:hypothetical protein
MHHIPYSFSPEYSVLLLSDRIILDLTTFDHLQFQDHHPAYAPIAETMRVLQAEGFLEVVDYIDILERNRQLLNVMVANDLEFLDSWVEVLEQSLLIWRRFTRSALRLLGTDNSSPHVEPRMQRGYRDIDETRLHQTLEMYAATVAHGYSLPASLKMALIRSRDAVDTELGTELRTALTSYLWYVNSNLILSNNLEAAFHDWGDFRPFYHKKFLAIGRQDLPGEKLADASRQLFEVSFPHLAIRGPAHLLKILRHKRVNELRTLVQEAAEDE